MQWQLSMTSMPNIRWSFIVSSKKSVVSISSSLPSLNVFFRMKTDVISLLLPKITPEQWGNFLCTLFDEWVKEDVGKYYVQIFDSTLANWMGEQPGICTMAKTCGHAGVMEFNGDVYSCDHFVFPEYKLGNIYSKTLVEMMHSERQHNFGNMKYQSLPTQCKECEFLFACNGECPKNRFSQTAEGEPGLNYLCKGYYQFFKHVAPYMDFMKNELMNQRPPANIMEALRNGELRVES